MFSLKAMNWYEEKGKSMKIWLVGHGGCYNRGCEAIVRTTEQIVKHVLPDASVVLWSQEPTEDKALLADTSIQVRQCKGKKTSAYFPFHVCYSMNHRKFPCRNVASAMVRNFTAPDCVISVGGDNFTLDYGPPYEQVEIAEWFLATGIPYVIWGASVGPFSERPHYEQQMQDFLPRVSQLTIRESVTENYLDSIGVSDNVTRVWDPAFLLEPKETSGPWRTFIERGNVVGINVSGLIRKWFQKGLDDMLSEVAGLINQMTADGTNVLLVPHVTYSGDDIGRRDHDVLSKLQSMITERRDQVELLPTSLGAREVKWCISQCRFFIGARTHSTIAAISSGVPTVAIAYSSKATGLWRDVFGNDDLLLPTPDMTTQTLVDKWNVLKDGEDEFRAILAAKRTDMVEGAMRNGHALKSLLQKKSQAA